MFLLLDGDVLANKGKASSACKIKKTQKNIQSFFLFLLFYIDSNSGLSNSNSVNNQCLFYLFCGVVVVFFSQQFSADVEIVPPPSSANVSRK
jgi:hypothetical protein